MRALAQTQLGDIEAAAESMRQALVYAAIPPQRFLAGPRRLFAPLYDHVDFAALREEHLYEPAHGPMLSSDRHRSGAYRHDRPGSYDLFEFGSAQYTNLHTHPIMEASLFGYNAKPSFGLLTFDTADEAPSVTYQIVNTQGEIMHELTFALSDLRR